MLIDIAEARAQLPEVGQRLLRVPSWLKWDMKEQPPRRCTVVEVSRRHLWYLVRYDHDGLYECFKMPELKEGQRDNKGVAEPGKESR